MRAHPMRVIAQKHDWDCGVACLAMLLDKDYGDIAAVVKHRYPVRPKRGLGLCHLEHIAYQEYGLVLHRIYKSNTYLLDQPTGILGVLGGVLPWTGHWVIWKSGVIIEPWHDKRAIYGLEEYLAESKCRTATLLVLQRRD